LNAKTGLERVLERNDLGPRLRQWTKSLHAGINVDQGNYDEAVAELEEAIRLDPSYANVYLNLSRALRDAGRVDEAVPWAKQAVALAPGKWQGHSTLYLSLSLAGRLDEAIEPARKSCELSGTQTGCDYYALALLEAGRTEEALQAARYSETLPDSILGSYNLACFWSLRKDRESALRWLRRSVDLGYANAFITRDQDFAWLHGDPEFERIVAEVKKRIGNE
jgi:tetratricopeptide (TPR) repeat protein